MDVNGTSSNSATQSEEDMYLRRGPWTVEEDFLLMNYIATHGEGRWNSLARCAGLKRTGKSCRLRWLNYLRPDVRRGNITPEEQLTILELHSRWGNRWSKIAQYLPGRTDNEIKNYWRTRVQKHAKQLKCDVNSKQFKDTMRYLWMPRLVERIRAASAASSGGSAVGTATNQRIFSPPEISAGQVLHIGSSHDVEVAQVNPNLTTPENNCTAASSESLGAQLSGRASDPTHRYSFQGTDLAQAGPVTNLEYITSPYGYYNHEVDLESMGHNSTWLSDVELSENLWNVDDVWFLQQQFCNSV